MQLHTAVIHYSATYPDQDYTWKKLVADHIKRGFRMGDYHWYIRRDGTGRGWWPSQRWHRRLFNPPA